jgi:hypothetical protein
MNLRHFIAIAIQVNLYGADWQRSVFVRCCAGPSVSTPVILEFAVYFPFSDDGKKDGKSRQIESNRIQIESWMNILAGTGRPFYTFAWKHDA